jgi:hypothetical protein
VAQAHAARKYANNTEQPTTNELYFMTFKHSFNNVTKQSALTQDHHPFPYDREFRIMMTTSVVLTKAEIIPVAQPPYNGLTHHHHVIRAGYEVSQHLRITTCWNNLGRFY